MKGKSLIRFRCTLLYKNLEADIRQLPPKETFDTDTTVQEEEELVSGKGGVFRGGVA